MTMLFNPRHERFAQGLAQGKTADEAYKLAGYAENRGNAIRLKANESVVARVAELQARVVDGVVLTREWVIESLINIASQSMQPDSPVYNAAVANRALELLGKELGMFVDRSENYNINYDIHPEPPSTKEDWLEKHGARTLNSCQCVAWHLSLIALSACWTATRGGAPPAQSEVIDGGRDPRRTQALEVCLAGDHIAMLLAPTNCASHRPMAWKPPAFHAPV